MKIVTSAQVDMSSIYTCILQTPNADIAHYIVKKYYNVDNIRFLLNQNWTKTFLRLVKFPAKQSEADFTSCDLSERDFVDLKSRYQEKIYMLKPKDFLLVCKKEFGY